MVANTLGAVVKYREDGLRVEQHGIADLVKVATEKALAASNAPGQLTIDDV